MAFKSITAAGNTNGLGMVEETVPDRACCGNVTQQLAPFLTWAALSTRHGWLALRRKRIWRKKVGVSPGAVFLRIVRFFRGGVDGRSTWARRRP